MKYNIWILICTFIVVISACSSATIPFTPDESDTSKPPDISVPDAEIPSSEEDISQNIIQPTRYPQQVYDRYVLTGDGEVIMYVPEKGGVMVPISLNKKYDKESAIGIQPFYQIVSFDGDEYVEYQTSVQFFDGSIYSFDSIRYMGFENVYSGATGTFLPYSAFIGIMYFNKKRIDGMRWFSERYCLDLNGTLYSYSNGTWDEPAHTGELIPIAENVTKATIGVYSELQFYLLYLTDEGALYFYTETAEKIINECIANSIKDFDISCLGTHAPTYYSHSYTPDILVLQRKDQTLSWGKYWEKTYSASMILDSIKAVAASDSELYMPSVQWFGVTEYACIVLGNDGTLAYSDEYPMDFKTIDTETDGLIQASIFHQSTIENGPPSLRYMLALYGDGEIVCRLIQ